MKKREREKVFDAVRSVIHDWDPYDLLTGGAPDDEFDGEISAVVNQLHRVRSPLDAAHAIARVFSSSFSSPSFTVEECREVGERLYETLVERDILEREP